MKKRNYQLTCLVSPDLTQEELENLLKKIESLISEEAEIKKTENPRKINLSYPVEKKTAAFLVSLEIEADSSNVKRLKEEIDKEKNILRYLLIKVKKEKTESKKIEPKKEKVQEEKVQEEKMAEQQEEEQKKEKKVGLEKVEEKLEEII